MMFFRGPDGLSLRAEAIRYVLYFFKPDMPSHVLDARSHFLYYLLTTFPPNTDVEQQWCKTVVWFDWLTYDAHTLVQFIEPVMGMIRQALANLPSKASSSPLMEYCCKPLTATASNSNHAPDREKNKENDRDDKERGKLSKTPSPPNGTLITQEKEREKEIEELMEQLRDDFKATMMTMRECFRETEDDSERGEAVQKLLQKLLENEDSIDEEQLEIVAHCVQLVMGSPVEGSRRSILPDPVTEDSLADSFAHPLFIIFRNLCYTPDTDTTTRSLMVNMIATMRDYDNTVTYLMLFFIKANDGLSSDCISCYRDVARARDEEIETLISADLQQCAVDDDRLFAFLVPYVFQKLDVEAGASAS
ncbi:hypothetical protein OSTOST_13497, partial [Ostertagia ostertagi]